MIWITGLSGSGKTTLGRKVFAFVRKAHLNSVFLDGDALREIFQLKGAYSARERLRIAALYANLCKFLSDQGIHVVCSTISLFHKIRAWNRRNIRRYHEIYMKVDLPTLRRKNPKNIYARAAKKKLKNVYGVDLAFEEPKRPDMIILNDYSPRTLEKKTAALKKILMKKMG